MNTPCSSLSIPHCTKTPPSFSSQTPSSLMTLPFVLSASSCDSVIVARLHTCLLLEVASSNDRRHRNGSHRHTLADSCVLRKRLLCFLSLVADVVRAEKRQNAQVEKRTSSTSIQLLTAEESLHDCYCCWEEPVKSAEPGL